MPEETKKEIPDYLPQHLSVLLIDVLRISTRTDGLHLVDLGTRLPEGIRWQGRFMVPAKNLRDMIDVLCSHTGHYPEKPKEKDLHP